MAAHVVVLLVIVGLILLDYTIRRCSPRVKPFLNINMCPGPSQLKRGGARKAPGTERSEGEGRLDVAPAYGVRAACCRFWTYCDVSIPSPDFRGSQACDSGSKLHAPYA